MSTAIMPTSDQSSDIDNASSDKPDGKQITRREFLQYMWAASAVLLMVEAGGTALWFALPHFRNGFEEGVVRLTPAELPSQNTSPVPMVADRVIWLRNTKNGLLAFDPVCVHDISLYKWVASNNRFECPRCGSKFSPDGNMLRGQGPASRDLDRY